MDQHFATRKCLFSGVYGTKGSIGTGCSALLPGINRRPNTVPARNGTYAPSPRRLATQSWGLEGNRLRGKAERAEREKVLALAQARKVDVILVTELTSWGRSVLNVL